MVEPLYRSKLLIQHYLYEPFHKFYVPRNTIFKENHKNQNSIDGI